MNETAIERLDRLQREAAQEHVAEGVKFLDRNRPGWWTEVPLARFDIRDPCLCVLGHIGAAMLECDPQDVPEQETARHFQNGYDYVLAELLDWDTDLAEAYGFEVEWNLTEYDDLQAEWERVIRERQDGMIV